MCFSTEFAAKKKGSGIKNNNLIYKLNLRYCLYLGHVWILAAGRNVLLFSKICLYLHLSIDFVRYSGNCQKLHDYGNK
jgi:hypothetical protein